MNLFALIVALIPLLSFALAWPARLEVPDGRKELTVAYHRASSSITVEALSFDALVGQACSAALDSGSFATLPIIFDVDERGSGNLTVGPTTYQIHEDIEHSGGIICGRMYNDAEAAVSCTVTVPTELTLPPLSGLNVTECIPNDSHHLSKTLNAATRIPLVQNTTDQTKINQPHRRQNDHWCITSTHTQKLGCGDPHQNSYHRQLSGTARCETEQSCSEVYHSPKGHTVSYTTSHDHAYEWISGGFLVRKEWTAGTDYTCSAGPGETVCVWYKFSHTAYTVRNNYVDSCAGGPIHGDPFILFSPNWYNDGPGGDGQYCVIGPCRHEGEWWWDYNGPSGDTSGYDGC